MANIVGLENMTPAELQEELRNGARFVVFSYCISVIFLTFKRGTDVYFIRGGESAVAKSLPWTILSLVAGWWGIPFGPIFTIWAVGVNLSGGKDVTAEVATHLMRAAVAARAPRAQPPSAAPRPTARPIAPPPSTGPAPATA